MNEKETIGSEAAGLFAFTGMDSVTDQAANIKNYLYNELIVLKIFLFLAVRCPRRP